MITQPTLKQILHYNPETGIFTRNTYLDKRGRLCGHRKLGCIGHGYLIITIKRKHYRAHRLAWLYMTGNFPEKHIDHIDGIRINNSWNNLREVTIAENNQNYRKARTGSIVDLLGVSLMPPSSNYVRKKPYRARINDTTIGYYKTKEEAYAAYVEYKRQIHPFCTI